MEVDDAWQSADSLIRGGKILRGSGAVEVGGAADRNCACEVKRIRAGVDETSAIGRGVKDCGERPGVRVERDDLRVA